MRLWSGYTDNYLRVLAHAPADQDLRNCITPTRLDAVHGETFFGILLGVCVGRTQHSLTHPHAQQQ